MTLRPKSMTPNYLYIFCIKLYAFNHVYYNAKKNTFSAYLANKEFPYQMKYGYTSPAYSATERCPKYQQNTNTKGMFVKTMKFFQRWILRFRRA